MEAIINYVEKYTNQLLFLQVGFLIIIGALLLWMWFYNRRKYHQFKHQIPASVVKSYLDSIIQNSISLKSSLFRGGGLDLDPNAVPSVMPVNQLEGIGATLTGVAPAGADGAELNSLRAQIAQLQSQLLDKNNIVTQLEKNKTELEGLNSAKQERIIELEKLLAEAKANAGNGDGDSSAELAAITQERDQLKETLQQYEVIEDDLANLKRLQQENEQLKKALAAAGGTVEEAPVVEEEAVAEVEESVPEPVEEEEPVAVEEPAEEPEEVVAQEASSDDKSPEDLLSEFEKMLG